MTSIDTPCDLAIIGGGLAGLTAGIAASERGLRVAIFERGADARYPQLPICRWRLSCRLHRPDVEPDDLLAAINWVTKDEADQTVARVMAENASRTVYWLRDHGVDFAPGPTPMHKFMVTPHRPMLAGLDWPDHGPDEMIKTLGRRLVASGGSFRRNAEVTALRMEDGKCAGLRVRLDGSNEIEIDAAGVLIADGGFQANQEMVGKYIAKRPDLLVRRSADSATGDGIAARSRARHSSIWNGSTVTFWHVRRWRRKVSVRTRNSIRLRRPSSSMPRVGASSTKGSAASICRTWSPALKIPSTFTIFDRDIWEKGQA